MSVWDQKLFRISDSPWLWCTDPGIVVQQTFHISWCIQPILCSASLQLSSKVIFLLNRPSLLIQLRIISIQLVSSGRRKDRTATAFSRKASLKHHLLGDHRTRHLQLTGEWTSMKWHSHCGFENLWNWSLPVPPLLTLATNSERSVANGRHYWNDIASGGQETRWLHMDDLTVRSSIAELLISVNLV